MIFADALFSHKALQILRFKLGINNVINSLLIGEGDCMFNHVGMELDFHFN